MSTEQSSGVTRTWIDILLEYLLVALCLGEQSMQVLQQLLLLPSQLVSHCKPPVLRWFRWLRMQPRILQILPRKYLPTYQTTNTGSRGGTCLQKRLCLPRKLVPHRRTGVLWQFWWLQVQRWVLQIHDRTKMHPHYRCTGKTTHQSSSPPSCCWTSQTAHQSSSSATCSSSSTRRSTSQTTHQRSCQASYQCTGQMSLSSTMDRRLLQGSLQERFRVPLLLIQKRASHLLW